MTNFYNLYGGLIMDIKKNNPLSVYELYKKCESKRPIKEIKKKQTLKRKKPQKTDLLHYSN